MVGLSCLKEVRGEARSKREEQAPRGQVSAMAEGDTEERCGEGVSAGSAGVGGAMQAPVLTPLPERAAGGVSRRGQETWVLLPPKVSLAHLCQDKGPSPAMASSPQGPFQP